MCVSFPGERAASPFLQSIPLITPGITPSGFELDGDILSNRALCLYWGVTALTLTEAALIYLSPQSACLAVVVLVGAIALSLFTLIADSLLAKRAVTQNILREWRAAPSKSEFILDRLLTTSALGIALKEGSLSPSRVTPDQHVHIWLRVKKEFFPDLIRNGFNPNIRGSDGYSPLACLTRWKFSDPERASALIKMGADPSEKMPGMPLWKKSVGEVLLGQLDFEKQKAKFKKVIEEAKNDKGGAHV